MSTAIPTTFATPAAFSVGAEQPHQNLAELVHRLGDIPLHRIRTQPHVGTATLADVAQCKAKYGCLCELVEGVLVEKAMGFREGIIDLAIAGALLAYNRSKKLGKVTSASSMFQIQTDLVRLPDVGFTFWNRFPQGKLPEDATPRLVSDLAVEVLSPSNTRREMERKRTEYFASGTQQVWMVDIEERTVSVYTAPETFQTLSESATLDGGELLPGFSLRLADLFAELDEQAPPNPSS